MLYTSEFHSEAVNLVFVIANWMVRPFLVTVSLFVSCFLPTTKELKDHGHMHIYYKKINVPVYFCLLFVFAPLAFWGFVIRNILHYFRKPYKYSCYESLTTRGAYRLNEPSKLCVATANMCLQGEWLSRMNNLSDNSTRADRIGERIVADQFYADSIAFDPSRDERVSDSESAAGNGPDLTQCTFRQNILTHFPAVDFFSVQECCDGECSQLLIDALHRFYPYILHNIGVNSFNSNCFLLNSGLLFASRFPILDADFKPFQDSYSQCRFISKGLLMVKVLLGVSDTGQPHVGYIYNTHLQVYQGRSGVSVKQLNNIMQWTAEFRTATQRQQDHLVFDIICGDFNFDNMSPGDQKEWSHPLFSQYIDVCREKPGSNHHWAVGTERRHATLWDWEVSSPEGLRKALRDPKLRTIYIIDADINKPTIEMYYSMPKRDSHGNVIVSPQSGRRKVDYLLFNKDSPVNVTNYDFITRLCPLTDHVSVAMTFTPAVH